MTTGTNELKQQTENLGTNELKQQTENLGM